MIVIKELIPICSKMNLTIEEASEYSGIGLTSLRKVLKQPGCAFVLHVGNKQLIKRKEFEKWNEKIRYI